MRALSRVALLLPVAACVSSSLRPFPYLAPRPGGAGGASFALLGQDAVDTLATAAEVAAAPPDAPLELTASDGAGLAIERLEVAAVIDGPLALTELHLTFRNPEDRELEGRFAITLPPDAAVSRFAMKNEQWLEAEIVARQRAREVYETYLHKRVDPALLEKDDGNRFSARVFPIPAKGTKELIVAYSQEVSASAPYRVRLAGLPRVGQLAWTVSGAGPGASGRRANVAPEDIVVDGARGAVAMTAGDAFAARLVVPGEAPADALHRVTVLVDTSASRATVRHQQANLVRAVIERIVELDDAAIVDVVAFDQTAEVVASGLDALDAATTARALEARGAFGASDLAAGLAEAARVARARADGAGRLVVVGDGVVTAGTRELGTLTAAVRAGGFERVDVITAGGVEDRATLEALVRGGTRPGRIVDGADRGRLVRALTTQVLAPAAIAATDAAWVWPATLAGTQPGDEIVVYGRRRPGARGPIRVTIGGANVDVATHDRSSPLLERAVARAEIERFELQRRTTYDKTQHAVARAEIERLALQHRLVTSETSLLVLESDADYARFCLGRTGNGDVLAIADGAITVVDRHDGKDTPAEPCAAAPVARPSREAVAESLGVSFSGATTIDNRYIIEGVNGADTVESYDTDAEVVVITSAAPTIDQSSTAMGVAMRGGGAFIDLSTTALGVTITHSPPTHFSEADLEPRRPPPYTGRFLDVMQHLRGGAHEQALATALRWQLAEPTDISALLALGEALEARGAPGLAARAYGSILDLHPGRVEMVRAAAERLDRLGAVGRTLAIEAYTRAVADRPDHVTGRRLLAWALFRAGRFDEALAQLEAAVGRTDRESVRALLRGEMGVLGAAWAAASPASRAAIARRLAIRGATIADQRSFRVVLTWETDANDVDLHVRDAFGDHAWYSHKSLGSGGALADDLTSGYGPEVFLVEGKPHGRTYHFEAHYYNRGPMGLGLGTVQIIQHDGKGGVTVEDRPYVIQNDGAYADLGTFTP